MLLVLLWYQYSLFFVLDTVLHVNTIARHAPPPPRTTPGTAPSRSFAYIFNLITRNIKDIITNLIIRITTTKSLRNNITRKTLGSRSHLFTILVHDDSKLHFLDIFTRFIATFWILIMFSINMKCPIFKTTTRIHISRCVCIFT